MTENFKNSCRAIQIVSFFGAEGFSSPRICFSSSLFFLPNQRVTPATTNGLPSRSGQNHSLNKTLEVVRRHIEAMGSDVFEIGLFQPDAEHSDSATAMIPRTWDADGLIRSVPWMRLQNLHGRNIYIRPNGEHDLSMVDDLNRDSVRRMFVSGFRPAVVVETSPGNYQAWLRHSRVLPKDVSTAAARKLAEEFGGDNGAADWRHFGRLAGFTNRKPKYQQSNGFFPFVRLLVDSGTVYPNADRFVEEIEAKLERTNTARQRVGATSNLQRSGGSTRTIEHFRRNPLYAGDGTRIDLAYAIYALSHGTSQDEVESAIRSRDLSHKGSEKRQAEYVERTIKKALGLIERNEAALGR